MSMLAERKRKQKWSLNPRGKAWAQDTNKFGQKLLEKMGWSHGKGLGAKEDGRTEHIKVSYKNDSQGMGYKESDDQWTEHDSNFSALLEALGGSDEQNKEIKLSSLEEKSQNSKARVHYRKFTRGKDLSQYSEKDLANIFGKKSLIKSLKPSEPIKEEKIEENVNQKNFSNGGLMSDYFKKKIPGFGNVNGYVIGNNGVLQKDEIESEDEQRPSFGLGFNQNAGDNTKINKIRNINESESETEIRSGFGFGFKQEKSVNEENNKQNIIKSSFVSFVSQSNTNTETPTKIKKDKKKRLSEDASISHEETPSKKKKLEAQDSIEQTSTPKKKDKSKKKKSKDIGLSNPAFDPLYTATQVEKHILEPIEESIDELVNETLNDTLGQVAENFEVQVQINNEVTPVKRKGDDAECSGSKKKKKKKDVGVMDMSYQEEESLNPDMNSTSETGEKQNKKKKKNKTGEEIMEEMDTSSINNTIEDSTELSSDTSKKDKKKKKSKSNSIESLNVASNDSINVEKCQKKKKSKTKGSLEGIDNPFLDFSTENNISVTDVAENPYEVKIKEKKKKKANKNKDKENFALEHPVFNEADTIDAQDNKNEEHEVKRKDKSKKKKKEKLENKGLDNPALNLNDSVIEESCDLMLNVVATPVQVPKEKIQTEEPMSVKKVKALQRRKSVTFSDITRERIIPSKEEIENETLDESRDIIEVTGKLNDSDLTHIDKFIQKKKAKKRNKGLENAAFDQHANTIEENISSISKTLDTYQAEIENDLNEAKITKSLEIEDIMVGEVGNPDGTNEKLSDGTVKLKFKYANFKKTAKYIENLTGAKKSYKHLIKGDIVMDFKETNLHEIDGYAATKVC